MGAASAGAVELRTMNPLRVAMIQKVLPHYRVPVFRTLAAHPDIDLTLVYGSSFTKGVAEAAQTNVLETMPFRVVLGRIPGIKLRGKALVWHRPAVQLLKGECFHVVIHPFETKWASMWRIRQIQRRRGDRFILWGHGKRKNSSRIVNRLRMRTIRSADAAVFYSERGRQRNIAMGADPTKLFVARNSLDIGSIDTAAGKWPRESLATFRRDIKLGPGPVLLHVGRFLESKNLDLLIRAAARLRPHYPDLKVALVGDGPCKVRLQELSCRLGIESGVLFPGRITDEEQIAPWFLSADLVVVPGAIGLLAIHTHAYGRVTVTTDRMSIHNPEMEILLPGNTGALFRHHELDSLTGVVRGLLGDAKKLAALGKAAWRRAHDDFGVPNMVNGFLQAISHVTGRPLALFESSPRRGELAVSGAAGLRQHHRSAA